MRIQIAENENREGGLIANYVPVRPILPTVSEQLEALDEHFKPQAELLGAVRMVELNKIVVQRGESLTKLLVRLQTAMNLVDEAR